MPMESFRKKLINEMNRKREKFMQIVVNDDEKIDLLKTSEPGMPGEKTKSDLFREAMKQKF